MTPTYNAYGGQVIYKHVDELGNRFETNNYSDQDLAVALGRMWVDRRIEDMRRFLQIQRLTPPMVVAGLNAANPQASDGRESVLRAVREYPEILQDWYDANPLPAEGDPDEHDHG